MLERLRESHRQVEASSARLSGIMDAALPDAAALQSARWDLATRVMQHMTLEDRHLFANLVKTGTPAVAAVARRYQDEYAQHVADYATHAGRWTADQAIADWDGYRVVTRAQLLRLARLIRKVENELYLLVDDIAIDVAQPPSTSWAREAFAIKDSITHSH